MNSCKNTNSIISFKNVSFSYDKKQIILNDLSFSIKENDYVCIVGKNGSGKTTLGHLLIGLIKPSKGQMYYNDLLLDKSNVYKYKNDVAAVLENLDSQFVTETVEDEIAFSLENINKSTEAMSKIINNIASSLNIKDLLDKDPNCLSGGQKQKVAIACCLAVNPKIIILDEATAMLDPIDKLEIRKLISLLHKKYNKTVISITHDIEEATDATSIMLIDKCKILSYQSTSDFFKDLDIKMNNIQQPLAVSISKSLKLDVSTDLDVVAKEVLKYAK